MARGFVFELEAVLEQRRRAEKERQRALAEERGRQVAAQRRVEQVHEMMRRGQEDLRGILAPGGGPLALTSVRMQATSGLHAIVLLQRAAIELAGINKRVEAARAALLQATIARKGVETLRERRYRAWKLEQERREAAELDDLNVMRHGRRGEDEAAQANGAAA